MGPLLLFLFAIPANSQTTVLKAPAAETLLSNAVKALTLGVPVSSVTLTGTATRTAGSDVETGAATLEVLGGTESRVDLSLTNGQQTETINQAAGAPAGQWSGTDGKLHAMSSHNCWIPASWFFPALALAEALNDPSVTISYIGQETRDGQAVQHVRFSRFFPAGSDNKFGLALLQHLTTADIYLDSANSLPAELDFNLHPDNSSSLDIPVEIMYGGYKKTSGILLPTTIQKLINHSVFLDLNITGVTINSNLSPAEFAVAPTAQQGTVGGGQ